MSSDFGIILGCFVGNLYLCYALNAWLNLPWFKDDLRVQRPIFVSHLPRRSVAVATEGLFSGSASFAPV
jgi:hypothetical protein